MFINFAALVERFGEVLAWHVLNEIERAARIKPQHHITDPEARLSNALREQDALASMRLKGSPLFQAA